jgi:simple sugar transport system ATP-binding protein
VLDEGTIHEHADKLIKEYDVRTPSADVPVNNLSGGNKQKVIIARELSRPIKLLIAAQPTRGVDVGSIEFIHKTIVAQRDSGAAVLLVSAELDEVMSLADRIAVMYHGKIVAVVQADQTTREDLGLLMAGAKLEHPEQVSG